MEIYKLFSNGWLAPNLDLSFEDEKDTKKVRILNYINHYMFEYY